MSGKRCANTLREIDRSTAPCRKGYSNGNVSRRTAMGQFFLLVCSLVILSVKAQPDEQQDLNSLQAKPAQFVPEAEDSAEETGLTNMLRKLFQEESQKPVSDQTVEELALDQPASRQLRADGWQFRAGKRSGDGWQFRTGKRSGDGWQFRAGKRAADWQFRGGKRASDWQLRGGKRSGDGWQFRTGKRAGDWQFRSGKRAGDWQFRSGKRAGDWQFRGGKRSLTEDSNTDEGYGAIKRDWQFRTGKRSGDGWQFRTGKRAGDWQFRSGKRGWQLRTGKRSAEADNLELAERK